jgi:hypothetical protein
VWSLCQIAAVRASRRCRTLYQERAFVRSLCWGLIDAGLPDLGMSARIAASQGIRRPNVCALVDGLDEVAGGDFSVAENIGA